MICKPCQIGADLSKYVREENITSFKQRAEDIVNHLHQRCKGETHCLCQHMVGDMISKESADVRRRGH